MELQFAFLVLTLLVNLFLLIIGFKAIESTSSQKVRHKFILVISLLVWQVYIFVLGSSGLLMSYEFPPRIALAFIFPSFIFTAIFLFKSRKKVWIKHIPASQLVYFQSFRVFVEFLLLFSFFKGIFNQEVTIEGYNFDMIFALSAPIVGYLVFYKQVISKRFLEVWNYTGLLVLATVIFVFLSSVYKPELYGSQDPLLSLEAFSYPYVLIAGFLMPVAVFVHILSIVQIRFGK